MKLYRVLTISVFLLIGLHQTGIGQNQVKNFQCVNFVLVNNHGQSLTHIRFGKCPEYMIESLERKNKLLRFFLNK